MLTPLLLFAVVTPAPITEVTVHSGHARVVRTATIDPAAAPRVELPLLPPTVDQGSVRLETLDDGAEIEHFTLERLGAQDISKEDRAVRLQLEEIDAAVSAASRERAVYEQLAAVSGWKPTLPEEGAASRRLDSRGWTRALAFLDDFSRQMQDRARAVDRRLGDLRSRREPLALQASNLLSSDKDGGWRVVANVRGRGRARLRLSYLVSGATWKPDYEVRLDRSGKRVTVALSGLVEQKTGEEWPATALHLSTAMPAMVTQVPRLPAWRLGERERFIPRSTARGVVADGPPQQPRATAADSGPGTIVGVVFDQTGSPIKGVGVTIRSSEDGPVRAYTDEEGAFRFAGLPLGTYEVRAHSPRLKPVLQRGIVVGEQAAEVNLVMEVAGSQTEEVVVMEKAPLVKTSTSSVKETFDMNLIGSLPTPRGRPPKFQPAPVLSMAPPVALAAPRPAAGSAAALAGGHESTFLVRGSPALHSGGERRLPIASWTWDVTLERALYPSLGDDSFLLAVLRAASDRPLPGGKAVLFVGDDPAGTADLSAILPGQSVKLPLGVDRAIRTVRRVTVQSRVSGLIWKEEVDRYHVTIEVTNPHAQPAHLQVNDQLPLSRDGEVEVAMVGTARPTPAVDRDTGGVSWRLALAPGASTTLSFDYELRRPEGRRLQQEGR